MPEAVNIIASYLSGLLTIKNHKAVRHVRETEKEGRHERSRNEKEGKKSTWQGEITNQCMSLVEGA